MKQDTILTQIGSRSDPRTGAVSTPIYQTATFRHPALGQSTGFDYSRTSNPTRLALEQGMAALEGADRAFAFASGLAAIDAILRLFKPGDRLVVTEDIYGGTFRLFEAIYKQYDITAIYCDTSSTAAIERALAAGPQALFIELPTNPLLKIADISAAAALARKAGAMTIVDNTFLTPWLCRPLALGADITIHSATKYLGGHNDVLGGIAATRTPELSRQLAFIQNAVGAVMGPQDAWLLMRGLKTLHLRLERQQANAGLIANWLAAHPGVSAVYYPGLPSHPGHDIAARQCTGYGAMVSFTVKDLAKVREIVAGVKTFLFAESLGGVESLITVPAIQTHADIPQETRAALGITDNLIRLSIGTENARDLIEDLERVL